MKAQNWLNPAGPRMPTGFVSRRSTRPELEGIFQSHTARVGERLFPMPGLTPRVRCRTARSCRRFFSAESNQRWPAVRSRALAEFGAVEWPDGEAGCFAGQELHLRSICQVLSRPCVELSTHMVRTGRVTEPARGICSGTAALAVRSKGGAATRDGPPRPRLCSSNVRR